MQQAIRQRVFSSLLFLLAACALAACAQEPQDVNRVQPNLVDKAMFEGEWWYSTTSIDTKYDETWVFNSAGAFAPYDGSMSTDYGLDFNRGGPNVIGEPVYSFPIGRIRFVIDEDYLFAFRAFELVAGGNEGADAPGFRGQPLAVFKIEDHVDIRKEYDETTGEETNVTSENSSDRLWHQRKYMRVDWSQNVLTQFIANDTQANELFTSFEREPVPFFFQAGAHPEYPKSYEPQFVKVKDDPEYARAEEWTKEDADTVHYMSFVTQEVWSPRGSCLTQGGVCASVNATMRSSFLRVPSKHEYAVRTETHDEFDHFGLFRSNEPTYARGGQDAKVQHKHCARDADCGTDAACDNAERREAECKKAGEKATCRKETNFCVGGLTDDRGETDFLRFFVSRHNLYADSLTDQTCVEDWECDGRYETCEGKKGKALDACVARHGSQCDPAAHRCTIAERKRPLRAVTYHLSPHFPPYLVRRAFEVVAEWNEVLMRGQRATRGLLPIDQELCGDDNKQVCATDFAKKARIACQKNDPTTFCYCGSPEESGGTCRRDYDAFESPKAAKERGVPTPYDCFVKGPADLKHPDSYDAYASKAAYDYAFSGKECLLTLVVNSCDRDADAACEELGDLRYHFLQHIQHGGASFSGVATPLSDPKTGELIVSNATVAGESLEHFGTLASQLYPVLRGEKGEDALYTGENVRGYFARLGKVEHPIATVSATSAGNELDDPSRPVSRAASTSVDASKDLRARMQRLQPKLEHLKGRQGRAQILSDRKLELKGTPFDAQLAEALSDHDEVSTQASGSTAIDAAHKELQAEHQRKLAMAARNMDVENDAMFDSQYHRYFAEAFDGVSLDEASLRMQQALFKAVALHEMGHALGLRHNFAASLDRDNYPDAYYKIATSSPLPTYIEYDDAAHGGNEDGDIAGEEAQRFARDLRAAREERLELGAGNVMSSSVMDYPGDLSDLAGLGRYDRAATLFAYFSKVEAYQTGAPATDPSVPADTVQPVSLETLERPDLHRRDLFTYYRGGDSCRSDDDCPHHAGRDTTVYQPITQRCVPNPRLGANARCEDAGSCVCSSFYDDFDAYAAGDAYRSGVAKYAKVDYLYCHDNRTSDLSWCTPFDAGESFQEVVEHYRRSWRERYPRAYFRNYRASGPDKGAAYSDVAAAVKVYQHMFFRLSYEGPDYEDSPYPLGFYDQLFASAGTFDWLSEIIGAPDVGSYRLDTKAKVYRQISSQPSAAGADLSLGVGQGYYLWSEYQTGLNGFSRLERAGTFLDKLLAIQALAKRDWGLTYQVDEFYYVNFFDFFEKEIVDLFGGLIMRDPRAYAPRVQTNAQGDQVLSYLSAYRGFNGQRANQDKTYPAPAVDGSDTEVLRDIATIEALANFPVYYDTSFEQRLLVWKLGSGDGYKIPDTRPDGTPTCRYGGTGCSVPDYIIYDSDRLHTSYVAVVIDPGQGAALDEQQLSFELLRRLTVKQERVQKLNALAKPSAAQREELEVLRSELTRDESFLEYLIELERSLGISSYFF